MSDRSIPSEPVDRRDAVLRTLQQSGTPLSITHLAGELGVHPNTVRFHVDNLLAHGRIERVKAAPRAPGRPPQLFQAVAGMDPAGPRHYQVLAEILTGGLAAEPSPDDRALAAGQGWGYRHCAPAGTDDDTASADPPADPVDRLVALLDDLGFAPDRDPGEQSTGHQSIGLRNCPFLELVMSHSQLPCRIHLGLMQGAMAAWRAPVSVDRLEPFTEPGRCVAHLSPAGAT